MTLSPITRRGSLFEKIKNVNFLHTPPVLSASTHVEHIRIFDCNGATRQ